MTEQPAPYGTGTATPTPSPLRRVRIPHLQAMKERGERWAMLTAYDQYAAEIFDDAGIPVLLVGDSAGNNVLGYETTIPVTVDELLPLVRAVTRAARHSLVVADLPFGSYQGSPEQALATATRFMKEGVAHAVKLEGGRHMAPAVELLTRSGIPVMAHVGFTPQSEHTLGGYRVQGRGDAGATLVEDCRLLEQAGAFSVVMEMVPAPVARQVDQGAAHPHDRHRRRPGLRRPGAGVAGHGRTARRHPAAVRQAVRRPAHDPHRRGPGLRRRRRGRHVPGGRALIRVLTPARRWSPPRVTLPWLRTRRCGWQRGCCATRSRGRRRQQR